MRTSRSALTAVATAAAVLLALAGCSSTGAVSPGGASSDCTVLPSGSTSEAVKVSGDFDAHPTATFTAPLNAQKAERSEVIAGTGELVTPGSIASADLTVYNGATGQELDSTISGSGGAPLDLEIQQNSSNGLYQSLQCSTVGSRIAAVMPASSVFGANAAQLGLNATDTVVFVIDIKSVHAQLSTDQTRATGAPQPPVPGLPTVTLADDGAPTVTIPDAAPPAELKVAVLKKGDGPVVEDGQKVIIQYQGVNWTTRQVFDQTWGSGPATMDPSNTIPGFKAAIVGQAVGSQILVVIPPDQGYGATGTGDGKIKGTDTIVFVIDILAAG